MRLELSTPALLFPTVSLIMLAYTNRFLALAGLIRALHAEWRRSEDDRIVGQIANLRQRVLLIRNMQALGAVSLLSCVLCMLVLLGGFEGIAIALFVLALMLMTASLALSVREIGISVRSLELALGDLGDAERERDRGELPSAAGPATRS